MGFQTIDGVPVWGVPEASAIEQIKNCRKDAHGVALMADHHLGYAVPIGGVVAYEDHVSPSGVGYDIACGNKAVRLDAPGEEVRRNIKTIMDDVWKSISFGVGRKNNEKVEHELFEDTAWTSREIKPFKSLAAEQLGTVGSGNHYVDLFVDEADRAWVGVHFGSRGLGHKLATKFLALAGGKDGMMVDPVRLDVNSDLGQQYLEAMHLAGRYAYAGRDWVCGKVASLLGAKIVEEIHNHHNFAWKENHGGKDLWVVRKGATPAFPGQKGFVGGSMGDLSVIVEGVASDESKLSYSSTVHGAGRVMGRREAAGKFKFQTNAATGKKEKVQVSEGKVSRRMLREWIEPMGVELRGAGTDESPHCYKRLDEVLRFHGDSIKVLHRLRPIGVAMAGEDEFDPYKD
jgi:tRNA-splicing ligase RtcB (3'-phosphate/5'-hydroxy nucleic acid ligase)